jgi:hypothetical protein
VNRRRTALGAPDRARNARLKRSVKPQFFGVGGVGRFVDAVDL